MQFVHRRLRTKIPIYRTKSYERPFGNSHANAKRNVKRKTLPLRLWSVSPVCLGKITNKTVVSFCGIQGHYVIGNVFLGVLHFASQMLKVSNVILLQSWRQTLPQFSVPYLQV